MQGERRATVAQVSNHTMSMSTKKQPANATKAMLYTAHLARNCIKPNASARASKKKAFATIRDSLAKACTSGLQIRGEPVLLE